ncbi:AlpA family transcriptional regulator [Pseudoalteromonas sp. T1lg75]|uniref:AlpA family transcriptional regulator n=1 Tax=Pseudoalteromonas sp. T1lg75 TaxID=2077102 RepID=UPI000CF664DD|nr:AlpA family transcriptional regulator [Pseudoalteromonas sp. T1lg75]
MKLIKLAEVKEITGLGRSTIYNFIKDGIFPKQVELGPRAVAWVEEEVLEWIEGKISARDNAA